MRLELAGSLSDLSLHLPDRNIGIAVLILYLALLLVALYHHKSELSFPSGQRAALFLSLSLLAIISPLVVRLRFSAGGLAWLGTLPIEGAEVAIPLLAALPALMAALWLGMAPAGLVGLLSGLAYASSMNLTVTQALGGAMFGLLLALLLHQRYRGMVFTALRQPLVATPLASLLLWPIPLHAYLLNPAVWSGGYAPTTWVVEAVFPSLIAGLIAGSILQVIMLEAPKARPEIHADRTPPYHRSLAGRLLARLLPLILAVAVVSLIALNVVTLRIAFDRTLGQMEGVAVYASTHLSALAQGGLTAVSDLVAAGHFGTIPPDQWQAALASATSDELPFQQILVLDRNARVIATEPTQQIGTIIPTEAEIAALSEAIAQNHPTLGHVYQLADNTPALSFVAPVMDPQTNELRGALLGRIALTQSAEMNLILDSIGSHSMADRAYLIDGQGDVILRAGNQARGDSWVANANPIRQLEMNVGQAYEEVSPTGEVQVVYWLRAGQPNWYLVLERGRSSIMQDAVRMTRPLLFTLAGLFILFTVGTVVVVQLQLAPIHKLAVVATRIANGELETPIPAYPEREDEIGEISRAIQKMTVGLGSGGEDLAQLVKVSQNVSSRANLTETLRTVLQGVTGGMDARTAGIYHIAASSSVWSETREGSTDLPADVDLYLEHLSQQSARNKEQIVVSDIESETSEMPLSLLLRAGIRAFVVVPMRQEGHVLGTLWAGWTSRRSFSTPDINYLAALANLAGIMIANNQTYLAVESERSRLATILNSTRDGILVTDARGQLQLANPAAEELLQFELATAHKKPLPAIISDENLFRMLSDIARRGKGTATTELERNGQRLYVSASPIQLNGRQSPQGWVLVMRDITEVKHLDDMKSDFLETVAHDMKTPLTYIKGYAGVLLGESLNETQIQLVEKIRNGIETLTQLINELSELSKITNKVGVTMSPCQLVTIAKEIAESHRCYVEDRGLVFHTEFPDDMPTVIGDTRLLRRAISNLVDNAIKYTTPPGWVKISVQEFSGSVGVTVADSGIGISPANRRRIFEFYRVRHRDTLHVQGTGLGLAMAKTIAEQHGGQVSVESELGAGSVFYLTIPKERPLADLLDEDGFFMDTSAHTEESPATGESASPTYGTDPIDLDGIVGDDIPPSV